MRSTVHYILPGDGTDRIPEPDYSSLLRDQEAAFSHAMKQTPPPSYQDIMDDQPPPYPASVQVIINNPPEGPSVANDENTASTSAAADEQSVVTTEVTEEQVDTSKQVTGEENIVNSQAK